MRSERRSCGNLPSKQAVAGSSPVSRSTIYIVSLLAGEKPPGDNQAAIWQARRRCFYVQKVYSDILLDHEGGNSSQKTLQWHQAALGLLQIICLPTLQVLTAPRRST